MIFTTDISGFRPKVSLGSVAKIITASTSGTTGSEKRVYYTENDLERTVEVFMDGISEMRPQKTLVTFPDTGKFSLGERIAEALKRLDAVCINPGGDWTYRNLVDIIEKEGPDSFIGFPQTLLAIQRVTGGCFQNALISGDYCIRADYICPVFPHYGSRETALAGAVSLRGQEGMFMRSDVDVLIIGEDDEPVPDGTEGELVITTHLEAMPLENYRTGDYTFIVPSSGPRADSRVRIGPVRRRAEIEELDDELFSDEAVIDAFAYRDSGGLKIERLLRSDVSSDSRPFYSGKRAVLGR